jgi:hypothetical protein
MENKIYETETVNVAAEIKKTINAIKRTIYFFIAFCIKSWIVILALIVIGSGIGFLLTKSTKPKKEASFFAHINYEMGGSVYNSIETINAKIAQKDSVFLKKINVWDNGSKIKSISITPVVRLENIVNQFNPSNSLSLQLFLENYDKVKDEELVQIPGLYTYYKQHLIKINLSHYGDNESILSVVDYLNTNPNIQKAKSTFRFNLDTRIKTNLEVIGQIDSFINQKTKNLQAHSSPVIGDQDFNLSELFKIKASYERDNENRYTDMALSEELVVALERINIVETKKSIKDNKTIIFPILLIFFFFMFSGIRSFYIKMRDSINTQNEL